MLHLAAFFSIFLWAASAVSEDVTGKTYPQTMKDLLMMDPNITRGAEMPTAQVMPSGCVQANGPACNQYSLPMAQAFTALANAGQCGPNMHLKSWTCAECRTVGFDVVPDSAEVVTGREILPDGQSTSAYVARVKGSFPGSTPRPAEDVKHIGEDCWNHCGETEGFCDWCGVGNSCVASSQDATQHQCTKSISAEASASVQDADSDAAFGCVLSVRGSQNVQNWIMNFVFPLEDMKFGDQCPKCKGVTGWLHAWREIEPDIMSMLGSMGCLPGTSLGNLLITGHSFGGAVATLAMFHLQRKGYNVVQSYNFESTRVGNQAWSTAFQNAFGRDVPVFRVTHGRDVVPRVPPQLEILHLGFDYKHVAAEVFFPVGADKNTNVICETPEDRNCADRELWLPSLLTEISRKFKDHCNGPLGEHGCFCDCPVDSWDGCGLKQAPYIV